MINDFCTVARKTVQGSACKSSRAEVELKVSTLLKHFERKAIII